MVPLLKKRAKYDIGLVPKVMLSHVKFAESIRYWNALIITLGPGAGFSFELINAYFARGYARQDEIIDELNPPLPPPPPSDSVLYVTLYALLPSERRGGVMNYRWALLLAPDAKPETRGRITPSARLAR